MTLSTSFLFLVRLRTGCLDSFPGDASMVVTATWPAPCYARACLLGPGGNPWTRSDGCWSSATSRQAVLISSNAYRFSDLAPRLLPAQHWTCSGVAVGRLAGVCKVSSEPRCFPESVFSYGRARRGEVLASSRGLRSSSSAPIAIRGSLQVSGRVVNAAPRPCIHPNPSRANQNFQRWNIRTCRSSWNGVRTSRSK